MNRRLFTAMTASIPTMMVATSVTATPVPASYPDSIAATVVHDFLTRVFEQGDLTAIVDTFAPPKFGSGYKTRFFEDLLRAAEYGSDSYYFGIALCFGDDRRALAHGQFGPGMYDLRSFFMAIWLEDGKIEYHQFQTDLIEYMT
jgi:hypothetical protein